MLLDVDQLVACPAHTRLVLRGGDDGHISDRAEFIAQARQPRSTDAIVIGHQDLPVGCGHLPGPTGRGG